MYYSKPDTIPRRNVEYRAMMSRAVHVGEHGHVQARSPGRIAGAVAVGRDKLNLCF